MNEYVNKCLPAGDKSMPEMHLNNLYLLIVLVVHLLETKKELKKLWRQVIQILFTEMSLIKLISVNKICITCLHNFFNSFFVSSKWTTSTISKYRLFKCISGMDLSPAGKHLFTYSFIFIHLKTKHLTMEFYSMVF